MRLMGLIGLLLGSLVLAASAHAATGVAGKAFNPDISFNALGLIQRDVHGSQNRNAATSGLHNGIMLQEAELQVLSDVDPYFRASGLLSISQKDGTTDYGLDPEEVFMETISLPVVTLKGGKFKAALGKHNQLHTHAFPFITAPLINVDLLGDEGLNEPGVSAAVLVPAVSWFSEFTVQALASNNTNLYNPPNSGAMVGVAQLRNLWDLTDDATFELTPYGTTGANAFGRQTDAFGADLIVKWRPAEGGKYHAVWFQTEYLNGILAGAAQPRLSGLASWVQYQFAERWWVQARAEQDGLPPKSADWSIKRRQTALVAFVPSEFSFFRIEYNRLVWDQLPAVDHSVALQFNFTIGAHPAHAY